MLPDLPASRFMRAFLEPCNEETYHAVVEKKEAEAKEIARLQQEYRKAERQAEAEKSQLKAEKLEAVKNARQKEQARINAEKKVEAARVEIETLKADLEDAKVKAATAAKKPKKGFKYWLERAGYVLGGVALGVAIDSINNKK
jgi:DNA-directed RNA polymerase beta subunit